MIEIRDYTALAAVIETGSVIEASKVLNRVPSAVSTRIQNLEDSLGVSLFLRENKKMLPTPEAMVLYDYAKKILEINSEAEYLMKSREPGGRFRLGALDSMAATRLPKALSELVHHYPSITLELKTANSAPLYNWLLSGEVDAILAADIPEDERVDRKDIFCEELVFITEFDHGAINTPEDVRHDAMLAFSDGCSYRSRMLSWFHFFNSRPSRIMEMNSYHAILGAVSAGMGIGIIPRVLLNNFPSKNLLKIHELPPVIGEVKTQLLWRKNLLVPNIRALMEVLQ